MACFLKECLDSAYFKHLMIFNIYITEWLDVFTEVYDYLITPNECYYQIVLIIFIDGWGTVNAFAMVISNKTKFANDDVKKQYCI